MAETIDALVIGAGVVGLAVARALAMAGRDVVVVESADAIGTETSSRNSEVIHAGLYYAQGSRMARHCVSGKALLYSYCEAHGVPFRRCGKLIAATTPDEAARLEAIRATAARNGVHDLVLLSGRDARALEPALACTAALLSPSTGILDSHAYMLALQGDAEAAGAAFAFRSPFLAGRLQNGHLEVDIGGDAPMTLACRSVINAAGLHASAVARAIAGLRPELVPRTYMAKGNYFTLAGRSPFARLIYPVPVPGGLGTHLTIDMAGQTRFGPDVEWVETIDYTVRPERAEAFYAAVRRYWPDLRDGALQPGYAGIRPKIVAPGEAGQDFVVQDQAIHGVAGLINLFGIESPGLTASLALADEVAARLAGPSG